ncbi:S8 family serine peptidase [Peptostreptococcus porci]|uniref:S8 family serine peptidase n=1 Tax=Peptostreptococcus porci TaxID=2652282 RepID=UPI002A912976|nr:S8 family serine peptidase [Peptostreptococcus porci]MDY5435113.1 S8 family serine peptidase [Peptostreptococcus porci]
MRKRFAQMLSFILIASMILANFNMQIYADSIKKETKISKHLKSIMNSENEFYDVMVLFKEKVSFEKAKKMSLRYETGESRVLKEKKSIIGEMQEVATKSQNVVNDFLEKEKKIGNVKSYENFYIVNSMNIVAKKSVIDKLDEMENIQLIDINEVLKREEPIEKIDDNKKYAPRSMGFGELKKSDEIEWNLKNIDVDNAWEDGYTGKGVTIGILDSAVDINNPAIRSKFRGYDDNGSIEYNGNFIDCVDGKTSIDKSMDMQHGTHCVGIMMGEEKDSKGNKYNRIGVAPDAKWINARVFGDSGESSNAGFLKAAEWMLAPNNAAINAPQIINNSWGGGIKTDTWFREAVKAWRIQHILPVFAAGNMLPGEPIPGPESICAPANYEESFAVGAVDKKGKLGYFSKQGPSPIPNVSGIKPEVSAPGVKIRSTVKNGYMYMSGTSMAAPHVCGVAALVKEADSSLDDKGLQNIIINTATPAMDESFKSSPNYGYGYGIVNAYAAVSKAKKKGMGTISGVVNDSNGNPIMAEVTVERTQNSARSTDDGSYSLKHVEGSLRVTCSSTGYYPQTKDISLKSGATENIDFVLKKKNEASVKINVVDNEGKSIEGAYVRILEDSDLGINDTDENGIANIEKIYQGEYTVRVFKDDYKVTEEKVSIDSKKHKDIIVKLEKKEDNTVEKEQYYDTDKMHTDGMKNFIVSNKHFLGGAVKFVPEKENAIIKDCTVKFAKNSTFNNGRRAKISVKSLDMRGRTVSLLKPIEVEFTPGLSKTINLEKYQIKVDKPYYIVVEMLDRDEQPFAIGVDESANTDYSYIFEGDNFIPIVKQHKDGGLMIRSTIIYPKNSEDIHYNVTEPVLEPIHPDDKKIIGVADKNQRIMLIVGNALRLDDVADDKGKFEFNLQVVLNPGEQVTCYGKDINGISSKPVRGMVLTNKSSLNEHIRIARQYLGKNNKENLKQKLKESVSSAEDLISEINEYEKKKNPDRKTILDYQDKIFEKVESIKAGIIELSPDKKELKLEIDKARLLLDEVWDSSTGHDVPTTKSWVKYNIWIQLKQKIDYSIGVYEDSLASVEKINSTIVQLKNKVKSFESSMKSGKKEIIKIDDRFKNGVHDGEGKTINSLFANHLNVTIDNGRIVNIEITEWTSSPESKKAIIDSKFLDKIVESNSLAVKPVKGFENECESVIRAIIQALEKRALKEGTKTDIDVQPLKDAISKSEELLNKFKISKNGKEDIYGKRIEKGEKWVLKKDYDDFKEAINAAKKVSDDSGLTIDKRNKARTLLYIAEKNFLSLLKVSGDDDDEIIDDKNNDDIEINELKNKIFISKKALYNARKNNVILNKDKKQEHIRNIKKVEEFLKESKVSKADMKKFMETIELAINYFNNGGR